MSKIQTGGQPITALYERLSHDDELAGDSNSIINQKRMLEDYAEAHGFLNCVHYTDDGYSGGSFDRPGWKQMLKDIESGLVKAVLAKDMSHVGRDYLQTGFYTEVMFRQHGVRFIAIANGVDSADQNSSEFVPFLNIMNEWYLRDCSRKQMAAYQARGKSGKPTANHAIYGYRKDPEDKHHWLVDEEAASVVRRIFQLSIAGNGPFVIAGMLRDDKVLRPAVYQATHGVGKHKNCTNYSNPYDWSSRTVSDILEKVEYLGHTANFKTYKESYKDKNFIHKPKEEWLIFENTHEAIIDPATWEAAQRTRKVVHRTDKIGIANPLTGLLFCADCGAKMYNHHGRKRDNLADESTASFAELYPHDHYNCSRYELTFHHTDMECCNHYINTHALKALILDVIRAACCAAIKDRDAFLSRIYAESAIRQSEDAKALKKKIDKSKKRSRELDQLMKKLYESFANGKITEKRFTVLSADYEAEQASLEELIASEQDALEAYQSDSSRADEFLKLAKKYTDFTELTPQMVYEFVDRILVHAPERSGGERVQEIEIYLKYIGRFDLPQQEPTAEEIRTSADRRKRREAYHRRKREKAALSEKTDVACKPEAACKPDSISEAKEATASEADTADETDITPETNTIHEISA